jgi:hypothetical protein
MKKRNEKRMEHQLTEWEKKVVREVRVLMKMTLPELMRVEETGIPLRRY